MSHIRSFAETRHIWNNFLGGEWGRSFGLMRSHSVENGEFLIRAVGVVGMMGLDGVGGMSVVNRLGGAKEG